MRRVVARMYSEQFGAIGASIGMEHPSVVFVLSRQGFLGRSKATGTLRKVQSKARGSS